MSMQVTASSYLHHQYGSLTPTLPRQQHQPFPLLATPFVGTKKIINLERPLGLNSSSLQRRVRVKHGIVASSNVATPFWDSWTPQKGYSTPSLSDILWPSAVLGKMDQILAPKGVSITIAPLGAVCAVLFASPTTPPARWSPMVLLGEKYNMFMAQIGCAAIGVLAFSIFGPGWLARSAALAASVAVMISTNSTHPPAASLPLLYIDGAKFHGLNFWYALFPGAAGCIVLSLIQEIVCYLKNNVKF